MRVRHLWSGLSVACAAALIGVTVAPLSGQSAPRTPWGDPDIQGTYTNTYENGTPLERPDEFAGRTLDQVKGEELANIRRSIQKRTIGAFLGPEHAPDNWWQQPRGPGGGDEDHALNATRAAFAIRQRTAALNEEYAGVFPAIAAAHGNQYRAGPGGRDQAERGRFGALDLHRDRAHHQYRGAVRGRARSQPARPAAL